MNCPLCKEKKTFLFHNKVWSANGRKVYRCSECDVVFIFPMFTDAEERGFYRDYNKYVKARGFIVEADAQELHRKSSFVAHERYLKIKKYFKKAQIVLEIGASTGAFLKLFKDKECYAVEPFEINRKFSKQFAREVYSDISEIPKNKKFDIICMFHSFEHIKNPLRFLKNCKDYLAREGTVLIEVPCIEDPLISLYNCEAFKDFYFQPTHPYVYSLKSLNYVFSRVGFVQEDVIFYQRFGLDNHLTWLLEGKPGTDSHLKNLFGKNYEYMQTLRNIKKTDTVFYVTRLKRKNKK